MVVTADTEPLEISPISYGGLKSMLQIGPGMILVCSVTSKTRFAAETQDSVHPAVLGRILV